MKKIIATIIISVLSLSACQFEYSVDLGTNTSESSTSEETTVTENTLGSYMGSWFNIQYPGDFTASPSEPVEEWEDIKYINTDEASFVSPEGDVEFFVYSPQWSGEPKDYLELKGNEKIISEETTENGEQVTKTAVIQSETPEYFREYESVRYFVGTGSEIHHVFGFKYKNEELKTAYNDQFETFKSSLEQFAD